MSVALLAACTVPSTQKTQRNPKENPEGSPAKKPKHAVVILPEGFVVKETSEGEDPFLPPDKAWRHLISRLTTLQVDTRRRGIPVLVTFVEDRVLITQKNGVQTAWRLPEGLKITPDASHVVIWGDLTLDAYARDGSKLPQAEELTVARGSWASAGPNEHQTREFRLVVKGGKAFRSITSG